MDVVVKSRHCALPEQFRTYVDDKITRLEKLNGRVFRVDVEVSAERNRRQLDHGSRVEITLHTKGPVVRAEAAAESKTAAFDLALEKLMAQLRKAADRRRVHRGSHKPRSLHEATASLPIDVASMNGTSQDDVETHDVAGIQVEGDGPLVVRQKTHQAAPMTLCEALDAMELVGHDFYLFIDKELQTPSVVYRRKGYDYGVIRLENVEAVVH
ncbi:ribosome hibernation-promoting factor, HPF/YfiA family [Microlunatus sp. Gsoil 973]|uniref:ribosome hibernation-promoting factor, HPF/YfiA family n=1 Tax=Microlunatus sp. Gsoil 973 TaxID=2672569 RepID=UPI0012B47366|nr:ribosome-associated translation inhibitor RaiA [Microlunatus sp. Gsoil 973]QGN32139.1 ribosome-associated translation inhibitor RaiA [Microlunatus sp. Gsoil 973]